MYDLIAAALKEDSEMIDLQWEEYTRQIRPLNCIPIIDMSSLVAMDPVRLYTAVGLGIIVSEKHKGDFKNHDDDPSLYGYDIKGVRRESKKTVRKHKHSTQQQDQGRYGRQYN